MATQDHPDEAADRTERTDGPPDTEGRGVRSEPSGKGTPSSGERTSPSGDRTPSSGERTSPSGERTPSSGERTPSSGERTPVDAMADRHGGLTAEAGALPDDRGPISVPFRDVLVPVDRDVVGGEALRRALPILECCGATIHVLYVRPTPGFGAYQRDRLRYDPDAHLERVEADVEADFADRPVEVRVEQRQGIPHREILTYAEGQDVDLIVMSTRGRRGLGLLLKGSTTQRVIAEASVPVMAMNEG